MNLTPAKSANALCADPIGARVVDRLSRVALVALVSHASRLVTVLLK